MFRYVFIPKMDELTDEEGERASFIVYNNI